MSDGDGTQGAWSEMKSICDEYGADPSDMVPSKYSSLDSLSLVLLSTKILLALDPDVYSPNAIRKECREVAEAAKKEFSLRRVEYEIGVHPGV